MIITKRNPFYLYIRSLTVQFRQITAKNIDILIDEINKANWNEVNQTEDANESYNLFHDKLSQLYNKALPMTIATNKEIKLQNKTWLTKGIQKSLKTKKQTI